MEVILDTNFIISCLMKRIDFLEELKNLGFKTVVPKEVLQELKDLKKGSKTSHEERAMIDVAFQLFERAKIKKTNLGKGKVDDALIRKGREGIFIATLDREVKSKVPNRVIILGDKKKLGVERD